MTAEAEVGGGAHGSPAHSMFFQDSLMLKVLLTCSVLVSDDVRGCWGAVAALQSAESWGTRAARQSRG